MSHIKQVAIQRCLRNCLFIYAMQGFCVTSSSLTRMAHETGENYGRKLKCRQSDITSYLAAQRCSGNLAVRLRSRGLITENIYQEVDNFGPLVTEAYKITEILNAVIPTATINPNGIVTFICILREMGLQEIVDFIDSKLISWFAELLVRSAWV